LGERLEIALRAGSLLGEGPTWDERSARLLWVDILAAEIHSFDPATGQDAALRTQQHVGAAKPRAGGGLVANLRDGIGLYDPDGTFHWLAQLAVEGCRGNDAAVDAGGHLWAGTMRYDESAGGGRLYRVAPGGEVVTVLDRVAVSNGIGWSPDGRRMYYVDSPTRRVDVFDVDLGTGLVAGRRTFLQLARAPGFPDGLAVDADGCLWVAFWDGGVVQRFTPKGRLDRMVEVPASRTTACAFGGAGLRDLYITTATAGLDAGQLAAQPLAGSLFVLADAGPGVASPPFAG
jgi:sugar lactone lactonase YvrE